MQRKKNFTFITFAIVMIELIRLTGVDERRPKSGGNTKYIFFIIHSYLYCCRTPQVNDDLSAFDFYRLQLLPIVFADQTIRFSGDAPLKSST